MTVRPKWIMLVLSIVIVVGVTGCNNAETGEKGNFIVNKGPKSILVASSIYESDVEKSLFELKEEDVNLMFYTIGDQDMLDRLQVGEKVTVQSFSDENGHSIMMYSGLPGAILGSIIRHSVNDEKWVVEDNRPQFVRQ